MGFPTSCPSSASWPLAAPTRLTGCAASLSAKIGSQFPSPVILFCTSPCCLGRVQRGWLGAPGWGWPQPTRRVPRGQNEHGSRPASPDAARHGAEPVWGHPPPQGAHARPPPPSFWALPSWRARRSTRGAWQRHAGQHQPVSWLVLASCAAPSLSPALRRPPLPHRRAHTCVPQVSRQRQAHGDGGGAGADGAPLLCRVQQHQQRDSGMAVLPAAAIHVGGCVSPCLGCPPGASPGRWVRQAPRRRGAHPPKRRPAACTVCRRCRLSSPPAAAASRAMHPPASRAWPCCLQAGAAPPQA